MTSPETLRRELPGGGEVLYHQPELPQIIDALAERDVLRSAFFTTEMGRRYWETTSAGESVNIADLEADAEPAERTAFHRAVSWGLSSTLDCIDGVEGVEIKLEPGRWLLRNHKKTLMDLRDELFGESE